MLPTRLSLPHVVTSEQQATDPAANFWILEIRTPPEFHPRHARHMPPLVAMWLDHQHARDLAVSLNADVLRRGAAGPWHLLIVCGRQGYGVLRLNVTGDLPEHPWKFPECVTVMLECHGHRKNDCIATADSTNAGLLKITKAPGIWNLPVRSLADPTAAEEDAQRAAEAAAASQAAPTSNGHENGTPQPAEELERRYEQHLTNWDRDPRYCELPLTGRAVRS